MQDYRIKTMGCEEVSIAIDWAAEEGWNPGQKDAEKYRIVDPDGFFLGLLDNKPVACISAVKYDHRFGFLGFYIVKAEHRGQGLGLKIWKRGLEHLEGCRSVGLDGVLAQQNNYEKEGFCFAYKNIRFEGVGGVEGEAAAVHDVMDLSQVAIQDIVAYDSQCFPAERLKFIQEWLSDSDINGLGVMKGNELKGYGVLRPCRVGYKIAPLYGDSQSIAMALLEALMSRVSTGTAVFVDVPATNFLAVKMAQLYNMKKRFETVRMYKGETPNVQMEKIYGVTSFEIG